MPLLVDTKNMEAFADSNALLAQIDAAHTALMTGSGAGSDFLGWVKLPFEHDKEELSQIKESAEEIRQNSDILVVVGIGGSYLGARAAIEYIKSPNYNMTCKDSPRIIFAGNNLSTSQAQEIFDLLENVDFSLNVISKSGTTTEPALAFRMLRGLAEKRYGAKEAARRIIATTDRERGALKKLADTLGYRTFTIPDNIGGRYSVLTAVGLLPMAVAGIDLDMVIEGAAQCAASVWEKGRHNPTWRYALARNALYNAGYTTEIMASYEPRFKYMAEWWKQLYGESEGKDGKGIFPASVDFTADLHSLGQYIQQGRRNIFETVMTFECTSKSIKIPATADNLDGLNFLEGKTLSEINKTAQQGTMIAHVDGGVPNILIESEAAGELSFGTLVYFFEFACALSGYLLGVNPFDQPGVEDYKNNMYALIGKPGYEERRAALIKRL